MNRQTIIAISAAVVLGLVAVYLANIFFNAAQRRNESTELTRVAVAAEEQVRREEIAVARDAPWRGVEIEEASTHADFIANKRRIWELIRTEIVRE